jgi:hypothetical protein
MAAAEAAKEPGRTGIVSRVSSVAGTRDRLDAVPRRQEEALA